MEIQVYINTLSTKIIKIHDRELFKYRPQNQLDLEPIFDFHLPRSSRIRSLYFLILVRGKKNQRNSKESTETYKIL